MLRGDKEPRRSARPLSALLGFRMGGVMEGYMLWAIATSAGAPILYRRFRLYGVPVASVQKTSIRASMGKAVEQNEGHFPRLSWAKTLGFLHV